MWNAINAVFCLYYRLILHGLHGAAGCRHVGGKLCEGLGCDVCEGEGWFISGGIWVGVFYRWGVRKYDGFLH